MPITLVTGVPGSGKTLYAVSKIDEAIKEGREVYSDIAGIESFEAVNKLPDDFEDWRELPEGVLIVLDEIHQRWPSTGRSGMSNNEIINDLDTHRHKGYDFILITQFPTKVHHEVRTNVSGHVHVVRSFGAQSAILHKWSEAQSNPTDKVARSNADTAPFRYPKNLYSKYKSATLHTVKFKMPAKFKFLFYFIIFLLCFISYFLFFSESALFASTSPPETVVSVDRGRGEEAKPQAATPPDTSVKNNVILGCISSDSDCYCYDTDHIPIQMDFFQCLTTMSKPIRYPMSIYGDRSR